MTTRRSALLALLATAMSACTAADTDSPSAPGSPSGSRPITTPKGVVIMVGEGPFTDLIEEALSIALADDPGPDKGGIALNEEVFADGQVTFAEYERAVIAALECVTREGFEVEGPLYYPNAPLPISPGSDPRLSIGFQVVYREETTEERDAFLSEVMGRCQAQWMDRISQVWLEQHAPTQEEVQAWLERAWACARDRGLEVSDPPTIEQAIMSVLSGCRPWEE